MAYVLGIDQSTQGTKAILFDEYGRLICRKDRRHKQWINEEGWISHDLDEIYQNVLAVVRDVVEVSGVTAGEIATVGISNQRETTAAWKSDGTPIGRAVVWQCARAKEIADNLKTYAEKIYKKTGLPLSPYFPAAKMSWMLKNQAEGSDIHLGTMDSWLVYRLTKGNSYKTDYSNASRTQLFNLHTLQWDEELCRMFGIPMEFLPEVCDSDSVFGYTDFDGYLPHKIPIHSVLGDSHGALFGQGCHKPGMIKTTYGTGSSVMMNIGDEYRQSEYGLACSLAWGIDGKVTYVLEGNINYTGAVITWFQDDVHLIETPTELEPAIKQANLSDTSYLVPAFTGLSAPHWKDEAKAILCGMTRATGRNEILKAGVESIAYQINDVLVAMQRDTGLPIEELRVDGGPTKNKYLMQFQSDISNVKVSIPPQEELSTIGVAYLAGIALGIYDKQILFNISKNVNYKPIMSEQVRKEKYDGWIEAVTLVEK